MMTSSIRSRQRCSCSDLTTARIVSKVSVPRMTEICGVRVSDFTSKDPLQEVVGAPMGIGNLNSPFFLRRGISPHQRAVKLPRWVVVVQFEILLVVLVRMTERDPRSILSVIL